MSGYRYCTCCGMTIIADLEATVVHCDDCDGSYGDTCDPANTYHCFTGYCDGSGCTYAGECEPATA
jgi:hypothetical protein